MSGDYRRLTRELRSQDLTRALQRRLDVRARQAVVDLMEGFRFEEPVDGYLISPGAWEHVRGLGLNPAQVFCHPELLAAEPFVSLYLPGHQRSVRQGSCGASPVGGQLGTGTGNAAAQTPGSSRSGPPGRRAV